MNNSIPKPFTRILYYYISAKFYLYDYTIFYDENNTLYMDIVNITTVVGLLCVTVPLKKNYINNSKKIYN